MSIDLCLVLSVCALCVCVVCVRCVCALCVRYLCVTSQERSAATVWLVCIVHGVGKLAYIQPLLVRMQAAFMELLGEKAQFTQESAARGLALVFDCATGEFKDSLIKDLLETLTVGRKAGSATRSGAW